MLIYITVHGIALHYVMLSVRIHVLVWYFLFSVSLAKPLNRLPPRPTLAPDMTALILTVSAVSAMFACEKSPV